MQIMQSQLFSVISLLGRQIVSGEKPAVKVVWPLDWISTKESLMHR